MSWCSDTCMLFLEHYIMLNKPQRIIFGIILASGFLSLTLGTTAWKFKHDSRIHAAGESCLYKGSIASGVGITAVVIFLGTQILVTVIGVVIVPRRGQQLQGHLQLMPQNRPSTFYKWVVLFSLALFWVASLIGVALLIIGISLGNPGLDSWLEDDCRLMETWGFLWGNIFIAGGVLLSVLFYIASCATRGVMTSDVQVAPL